MGVYSSKISCPSSGHCFSQKKTFLATVVDLINYILENSLSSPPRIMKNIEPWLTPQVCGVTVIVADKYFDQTSRLLSGAVYV